MESLLVVASDEKVKQNPNMLLPQYLYRYDQKVKENDKEGQGILKKKLVDIIVEDSMGSFYLTVCSKYGWNLDDELLKNIRKMNEMELEGIEKKINDAEENAGEMEVLDCLFEKARFFSKVGDSINAITSYDLILSREKTTTGKKIDASMEKARVALFQMDMKMLKETIAQAKKLVEAGGDWDRRNRLKVYEAMYLMARREVSKAASLLLECIATFSCVELCSYQEFMAYTIITSIASLSRTELTTQVVKNPQVQAIIRQLPNHQRLLLSLFNCSYDQFFRALIDLNAEVESDRFIGPHLRYLMRELRVLAYSQFLEAYRSVMLSSMAVAFGISADLLDEELSRFISAGRLNAKIDKVGDIIETSRPDKKNAQYQSIIKKGDGLLNHIQKLARLIDV